MDKKELFNAFKLGIEKERSAQEFYKRMIKGVSDVELKQIFITFLDQEEKHERKLSELYAQLKEDLEGREG